MGVKEASNQPSSLEDEERRLREYIIATDQVTWMIRYLDRTVGAVWLSLKATEYLDAPSIHIMIGEVEARGRGVGKATLKVVIDQQRQAGQGEWLHSRCLVDNVGSAKLLESVGFVEDGQSYQDGDGLRFQNVKLKL